MDAFELLKADHKKVAELFDLLETAIGKRKLDVFKRIKSELELHTHIEEKIFYPALEKPEETHDLTLEAYEEHEVVKTLLAELARAKSADDEWQAKAKVLRENVEHHVKEEENELFDAADDALTDEEIETLGNRMAAEKTRKQGSPARKQVEAKNAGSSKASSNKPGILSKIANFVGLGGNAGTKRLPKRPRRRRLRPAEVLKLELVLPQERKPGNPQACLRSIGGRLLGQQRKQQEPDEVLQQKALAPVQRRAGQKARRSVLAENESP